MPYESTTRGGIRQQILAELKVGQVLPNTYISSAAAGSVTVPTIFQDTGAGTGTFNHYGLFRPGAATTADEWRLLGDLGAAGLVNHRGPNYSDTTTTAEVFELWDYVDAARPDLDINDLLDQVLKEDYFTSTLAFSHLSPYDGDMSKSTDTDFTDVGTPTTSAKATTDIRTPWGPRSYHLINDAAGEGTMTASLPITGGRRFSAFAINSTNVGTSRFQPYDATNLTTTGMPDALTSSEQQNQLFEYRYRTGPTSAKKVAMQMTNDSATGDSFWDQVWLYRVDDYKVNFPAYISEGFKAFKIMRGRPTYNTAGQVWDAGSIVMEPLVEGLDYELMFNHADANPYAAVFTCDNPFEWPLFIEASRPYFDVVGTGTGFATDAGTYPGPLRQFIARAKKKILETCYLPRYPADVGFRQLYQQVVQELKAATYVRTTQAPVKALPPYAGPVRRM